MAEYFQSTSKYPILKAISQIYKYFGIIACIIFGGRFIYGLILVNEVTEAVRWDIVLNSIVGLIGSMFVLGFSETVKLFMDIENNTSKILANNN